MWRRSVRRAGFAARRRSVRQVGFATHHRLGGTDRGANPVELAVVMPVIFLLLFGSIQVAAVFIARSTALHAAQSGVNAQRVFNAPPDAGADRARRFLTVAGGWLVDWDSPGPSCQTDATEVTCTVRGRSLSVVPGVDFPVHESAHGTVERWTAP
ncbi:TadE family protein [Salinispora arenicola]|uniref:TadE family protein n=1 Tax=Salinispora arenicola TaxID=168697 RepID=UPI0003779D07|nr:TadE family protein [Salinispora arenicola]